MIDERDLSPRSETRGDDQPPVPWSTLPTGTPGGSASGRGPRGAPSEPSPPTAPLQDSRGAPRAGPGPGPQLTQARCLAIQEAASSPLAEMDAGCVRGRPIDRDPGPGRAEHVHRAPAGRGVVCPSGAKRALRMLPRRKVSCRRGRADGPSKSWPTKTPRARRAPPPGGPPPGSAGGAPAARVLRSFRRAGARASAPGRCRAPVASGRRARPRTGTGGRGSSRGLVMICSSGNRLPELRRLAQDHALVAAVVPANGCARHELVEDHPGKTGPCARRALSQRLLGRHVGDRSDGRTAWSQLCSLAGGQADRSSASVGFGLAGRGRLAEVRAPTGPARSRRCSQFDIPVHDAVRVRDIEGVRHRMPMARICSSELPASRSASGLPSGTHDHEQSPSCSRCRRPCRCGGQGQAARASRLNRAQSRSSRRGRQEGTSGDKRPRRVFGPKTTPIPPPPSFSRTR